MADLYSTLGVNARKTTESYAFGTRDLVFLQIDAGTDLETDFQASGSAFFQLIEGLQKAVEIYGVGRPNGDEVTVIVSRQSVPFTGNEADDAGDRVSALEDLIEENDTFSSARVFHGELNGWSIENDC